MPTPSPLATDLLHRRKALGLLQVDVGRLAGIGQAHVSRIEAGGGDPRLSTLTEIARSVEAEIVLVPRELVGPVRAMLAAGLGHQVQSDVNMPAYSLDEDNT